MGEAVPVPGGPLPVGRTPGARALPLRPHPQPNKVLELRPGTNNVFVYKKFIKWQKKNIKNHDICIYFVITLGFWIKYRGKNYIF